MQLSYQTNRLLLRVLNEDSAPLVLNFYQKNRHVFFPFEPLQPEKFYTLAYQEAALKAETQLFLRASSLRYYVFERSNENHIIGTICFSHILHAPYNSCKVGYRLDIDAQKKGYAYEALSFLLPLIFTDQRLYRVEADIMPENEASIQLIERLGFFKEGLARSNCEISGVRKDHLRYSLLASDEKPYRFTNQN